MPDCEAESVLVPDCIFRLSEEDYHELEQNISPNAHSTNYGIDLYLSAVEFVERKI